MRVETARRLLLLGFLFGMLVVGGSREALGKGARTSPANALVQRGEAALLAGELATAEQALTAAYRQTPHADLLFQLGRLAAAQDQLLSAQDLMRRYLNDPAATPDPAKAAEAQKVLARPRPPSGKVRVQGDRGGLVTIDGRLLGKLPLVQPLLAAPGSHTVAIQYPGKLLDIPIEVTTGRMVDIQCTRATGAIFLAALPALLILPALPEIPPALLEQLLDAVERAAQGERLTILKPEALLTLVPELRELPPAKAQAELQQCQTQPDCLQRLLQQAKLDYALKITAKAAAAPTESMATGQATEKASDKSGTPLPTQWEFSTELVHVRMLGIANAQTQRCSPCTEQKAAAALQEAVSRTLAVGLVRPRGTLAVTTEPAGVQVWLGDRLLGQTPLALPTWVGEYVVELRQPGHPALRRTIAVEAGPTAVVATTMPVSTPPPDRPAPPARPASPAAPDLLTPAARPAGPPHWERGPRPRWRLTVGATSLLVGTTIALLGNLTLRVSVPCPVQFDAMTNPLPPLPGCEPDVLDNRRNQGIGTIVVGGALMLTGIGFLIPPGPRRLVE